MNNNQPHLTEVQKHITTTIRDHELEASFLKNVKVNFSGKMDDVMSKPHLPKGVTWYNGYASRIWQSHIMSDRDKGYELIDELVAEAERRGRIAGIREAMEVLPELIDCEPSGYEMPTDPGLAADQARNYTIKQIRSSLESLIQDK